MRRWLGFGTGGASASTRRTFSAIATVGLLLAAAGCGDDSSDDAGDDGASETPASTTTTTHPSTEDDEEAAFDIIRDLEAEQDRIIERLYSDPSVVDDPDNPDLQRLVEISPEYDVEGVKDFLSDLDEQGQAQVAGSSGVYLETYVSDIENVDANTIRYVFCSVQDMVKVDSDGNELDDGVGRKVDGIRQARREDGVWRLAGTEESVPEEIEPGSAFPGYCESLIVEDPEAGEP